MRDVATHRNEHHDGIHMHEKIEGRRARGTRTVISIVLAESFGIPMSAVKVNLGSSKYPASAASGGSITVGGVSGAHRRAALTALADLYEKVKTKYNLDSVDGLSAKDEAIYNGDKKVCTWKEACALLGNMPLEVQGKGPAMDGLTSSVVVWPSSMRKVMTFSLK